MSNPKPEICCIYNCGQPAASPSSTCEEHKHPLNKKRGCDHAGQDAYWIYDGKGIPLAKVCPKCEESTLKRFRPDILEDYDCDERIEDDY